MSTVSVVLVLSSALIHAAWNLLLKGSRDTVAFSVLFLWVSTLSYLPAAVWSMIQAPGLQPGIWPFIALTIVLETGYWYSLAQAYRRSDMSQAYPLIRGLGAVSSAILGVTLLGERLTPLATAGIVLAVMGGYVLHMPAMTVRGFLEPLRRAATPALGFAILGGLLIGGYSANDRVVMGTFGAPVLAYFWVAYAGPAVLLLPMVGRAAVVRVWQENKRRVLAVGLISPLSYLLVLTAMATSPVSRVAVLRESSLIWGTFLGITVLKESYGLPRLVGAAAIALGVLALVLAR